MPVVPPLLEAQRRFLAALYDDAEPGPLATIAGNGLAPAARLRIYRHSSELAHVGALRTSYPAVLALVGDAFFDQTARSYRRAYPSQSGNLQRFGAHFADYLASLPSLREYPYLPDVARLEWQRQLSALASDTESLPWNELVGPLSRHSEELRIGLHPSVHVLASDQPVLTIWHYATDPTPAGLSLPDGGESVVLWREDGEVAIAAPDAASFACIEALVQGYPPAAAHTKAHTVDPGFDLAACLESLARRSLITAVRCISESRTE